MGRHPTPTPLSERAFLNMHTLFISCEVCHMREQEPSGPRHFAWSNLTDGQLCPNPDMSQLPWGEYGMKIVPVKDTPEGLRPVVFEEEEDLRRRVFPAQGQAHRSTEGARQPVHPQALQRDSGALHGVPQSAAGVPALCGPGVHTAACGLSQEYRGGRSGATLRNVSPADPVESSGSREPSSPERSSSEITLDDPNIAGSGPGRPRVCNSTRVCRDR